MRLQTQCSVIQRSILFCDQMAVALGRHSECPVRPFYQMYCLDLALLLYIVSVVFSCCPPNMSVCWGTSTYVLRGKFVPRTADVKCSGSLVNIQTCTVIKTSNYPVLCYFLVKKVTKPDFISPFSSRCSGKRCFFCLVYFIDTTEFLRTLSF